MLLAVILWGVPVLSLFILKPNTFKLFDNSLKQNEGAIFRICDNNDSGVTISRAVVKKLNNSPVTEQYVANNENNTTFKEIKQLVFGEGYKFNYDDPTASTGMGNPSASLVQFIGTAGSVAYLAGNTVVEDFKENKASLDDRYETTNLTRDLMTYAVNGPNNELWLSDGYGFGFNYTGTGSTLQIAVKNVGSTPMTLQYLKADNSWGTVDTITSSTEDFYRLDTLTDKAEGKVVLKAVGSGVLSLTRLKVQGYTTSPLTVENPTGTEDSSLGISDISYTRGYNSKAKVFNKNALALVKFTTSADIEDVTLDSYDLVTASKKVSGDTAVWTIKFKTDEENAVATVTGKIYDKNGNYASFTLGEEE